MIDWDDDGRRPKYRLCRAGFALTAIGLGLLAFSEAVTLAFILSGGDPTLGWLLANPRFEWVVGAPIPWTTLLGSYLLWAGGADASWRRRAGLLLLLNLTDAVQWTIEKDPALGLRIGWADHIWLREQVTLGFGWAEFALMGSLAAELAATLGAERTDDAGNKVRSLATAGAVLWAIRFLHVTDWRWRKGWPLVPRGRVLAHEGMLMHIGSMALTLITTLNVIALTVLACRGCSRALVEPQPEERGLDLLKSRSETDDSWE